MFPIGFLVLVSLFALVPRAITYIGSLWSLIGFLWFTYGFRIFTPYGFLVVSLWFPSSFSIIWFPFWFACGYLLVLPWVSFPCLPHLRSRVLRVSFA